MTITAQSTITSKGRVTIPQAIRTALDLKAGEWLKWHDKGNGVYELVPVRVGRSEGKNLDSND